MLQVVPLMMNLKNRIPSWYPIFHQPNHPLVFGVVIDNACLVFLMVFLIVEGIYILIQASIAR